MNKVNVGNDLYLKGRIGWRGLSKDEYLEDSDYRIINATSLEDNHIDWNNCGYISKERYEESPEIQLKENDILISKDGTLGKVGYVKSLTNPTTVASGIFVLRNTKPNIINFDYLYHVLKSNIFKDFIRRNKALGSTINHLYQRDLENFELKLPRMELQTRIANILNSIEDKILNNTRINAELEGIIKTIIDLAFSNNLFNYDNPIALDNVVKRVKVGFVGSIEPYYCTKENGIPLIRTTDLTNYGINYSELRYVTREFHNKNVKSQLKQGDLIIARHGDNGRTNIFEESFEAQVLNAVIIEPDNNIINGYLLKYLLQLPFIQKMIKGVSGGSVQGVVNTGSISKLLLPINIKNDYIKITEKIVKISLLIENYNKESRQLLLLRDFLLPLLINGKVTFKIIDDIREKYFDIQHVAETSFEYMKK